MKLNAVKFKDKQSFDKNKSKSNVVEFYDEYNVIVFNDKAYVKPNKSKVSHVEQILSVKHGVPAGTAILKPSNYHVGLGTCERFKLKVLQSFSALKSIVVEIPEHMAFGDFYQMLMDTNAFDYVEPDVLTKAKTNATFAYGDHWQLVAMDAQAGWNIIAQNPPPTNNVVAVFDIGCEITHPDLVGQTINNLDTVTNTPNVLPVSEFDNHGTCCAGLIVANPTNNYGTIGVAGPYTKVSFVNLAVMTNNQYFISPTSRKLAAVNHALSIPNCVAISMSIGGGEEPAFGDALNQAQIEGRGGLGIVCCASSGNNGSFNNVQYPAYYPGVCSIGALDLNGFDYRRASYSNYGSELFAAAPGSETPSTDRTGAFGYSLDDTTYFRGTSAACPIFAGAVAAVAAANPSLTANAIKTVIAESCIQVGGYNYSGNPLYPNRSYETGYGMVHIGNAVSLAVGGTVDPDPNIPINIRVTLSTPSLTFPGTTISAIYTVICNQAVQTNTTIAVTIFKSANTTPALEPADTVLTTVNVVIPAGQFRVQGTYSFLVDNTWVGSNYIGTYAATLPGEVFTADNYAFRVLQVIGETPPPNLNLKARIQDIVLSADGTKVKVYFDIENTGTTTVDRFTIKKGFVGYEEYDYEIAYTLTTGKFYVEETFWEILPPPNFVLNTPYKVEITSVNGIFPDDVNDDNISTAYVVSGIGG